MSFAEITAFVVFAIVIAHGLADGICPMCRKAPALFRIRG